MTEMKITNESKHAAIVTWWQIVWPEVIHETLHGRPPFITSTRLQKIIWRPIFVNKTHAKDTGTPLQKTTETPDRPLWRSKAPGHRKRCALTQAPPAIPSRPSSTLRRLSKLMWLHSECENKKGVRRVKVWRWSRSRKRRNGDAIPEKKHILSTENALPATSLVVYLYKVCLFVYLFCHMEMSQTKPPTCTWLDALGEEGCFGLISWFWTHYENILRVSRCSAQRLV